ncbi:hypothetical protein SADUNF_Sadunf01G0015000 [Salix dunnii]|uniref:Uncharacterized protein n=1 Tax=Salix dunnii TaxID=1413687 RepID=A0A835TIP0_9ROSI|nr:hypothetical protein SADUNF_Sadunf01G0015000 [Salix dunnii]
MEIVGATTEQMKRNDHVSLDIDKLTKTVQEELKTLHAFSDKCSIYRVPKRLRGSREYAYTPQIVSIGPIHHGKEELREMEVHKKLYLQEFLERGKASVEKCIVSYCREGICENGVAIPKLSFIFKQRMIVYSIPWIGKSKPTCAW